MFYGQYPFAGNFQLVLYGFELEEIFFSKTYFYFIIYFI